jgi:squalene/oxidosqualene cyclase-like protein
MTYLVNAAINVPAARGLRRYLLSRQNADGSFGLHIEGEGTVFVTALAYAALRMLGVGEHDAAAGRALEWIHAHGGPTAAAPWGKFMMALLGLYEWKGLNPVLPELWLLPLLSPMHPSKMWCHTRVVYLPMAYLYGRRVTARPTPLLESLRRELYGGRYEAVDWRRARSIVSPTDVYRPDTAMLRAAHGLMRGFELVGPGRLREKALERILDHIRHEDDTTGFIDLGPVNKLLNTACEWSVDPASDRFKKAAAGLPLYLWWADDGVKMNGYNSLQLWDTVFSAQALLAQPGWHGHARALRKMHGFIRANQVRCDVPDRAAYYRDPSRGGWPFSNLPHGWPISDCTAEGFKTAVLLSRARLEGKDAIVPAGERIEDGMLKAAVDLMLHFQNDDGGWASYEKRRGGLWYERLNPSCIFGDIMTEVSYVECSSSCMQALGLCLDVFPGWQEKRIRRAVSRGKDFILSMQRADGSWEGSWGVCFTYAAWFATWGLRAAGMRPWHPALAKAARFLLSRQRADGGWGEHYSSCPSRSYVQHEKSQPVMTAWAAMALMAASGMVDPPSALVQGPEREGDDTDRRLILDAVERAVKFLVESQGPGGDWHQDAITGVFNKTCMITYDNYRRYFPLWALGLYESRRGLHESRRRGAGASLREFERP